MKRVIVLALFAGFISCNSNSSNGDTTNDTTNEAGMSNPSSIDTTKHPDGMINGSIISTDTAAMNTQNAINKGKEAKNK